MHIGAALGAAVARLLPTTSGAPRAPRGRRGCRRRRRLSHSGRSGAPRHRAHVSRPFRGRRYPLRLRERGDLLGRSCDLRGDTALHGPAPDPVSAPIAALRRLCSGGGLVLRRAVRVAAPPRSASVPHAPDRAAGRASRGRAPHGPCRDRVRPVDRPPTRGGGIGHPSPPSAVAASARRQRLALVVDVTRPCGLVELALLPEVPPEERAWLTVSDAMVPLVSPPTAT